jgi:hypothetical protein
VFWNRGSFSDLDDAAAHIAQWDNDPVWTVYYSVGKMANNTETDPTTGKSKIRRTKAHATWFKTLCFDLDIGGKYATQKQGHMAVLGAVRTLGLPTPMVVSSGRGIHYYWPLAEAIEATRWEQVSIALRLALASQQVEIDTSKIHDTSMVLRPADTHHKKQVPWKVVTVMNDAPDSDINALETTLANWISMAAPITAKKVASGTMAAILRTQDLDILAIGKKCPQIGAILGSAGEFNALGQPVLEPLWRDTMGLAAFATDQDTAIHMLASGHPTFDFDDNRAKMLAWTAGPPTCAQIEKNCTGGCNGCQYKGVVVSPASLNQQAPTLPAAVAASPAAPTINPMPDGYYVFNGAIYLDIDSEKQVKDPATGDKITVKFKEKTLICPYELHVVAMYHDVWSAKAALSTKSTAVISVKYPLIGWQEHEMHIGTLTGGGKEFSSYLGDRQIFITSDAVQVHTRRYLMNYLAKVQSLAPSGIDHTHFGWQKDGSFLCGELLVGKATNDTKRRLKGTARNYAEQISQVGSREEWAELTRLIDEPGGECLGVSLLTACAGALGNISGAGTPIISFVAAESGTGKTQSLAFGNSAFMNPSDRFMFNPKDTSNALYNGLGILGDLSGSIDEITTMEPPELVKLAYDVSLGREKKTLTKDRDARLPEEWRAPVRVSSNRSLFEVYEIAQSKDEPLRMRTLEFPLESRDFVGKYGAHIYGVLQDNYGWALPEICEGVIAMGGRRVVWDKGLKAFEGKYRLQFESEERFRKNVTAIAYIVGHIGKKLGIFRFDVDRIIRYMVDTIIALRSRSVAVHRDAFDIIGQFMQEHNHQLIITRREVGKAERVDFPAPEVACMRMELVVDAKGVPQAGSRLAINNTIFKEWLRRTRDSLERVTGELTVMGGALQSFQRVTMYKGCQRANPGQAHCLIVDLLHQRMASAITGRPTAVTNPSQAVLQATP